MSKTVGNSDTFKDCTRCKKLLRIRDDDGTPTHVDFVRYRKDVDESWQAQCKTCKTITNRELYERKTKTQNKPTVNKVGRPRLTQPKVAAIAKTVHTPANTASAPVLNTVNVAPVKTVQPCYQFINVEGRLINLEDVSVIDPVGSDAIEIVMRSTEMTQQGFVHSRVYTYSGAARDLVLASVQVASGQAPQALLDRISVLEVVRDSLLAGQDELKKKLQAAEVERDTAMNLAAELESKRNQLKALL